MSWTMGLGGTQAPGLIIKLQVKNTGFLSVASIFHLFKLYLFDIYTHGVINPGPEGGATPAAHRRPAGSEEVLRGEDALRLTRVILRTWVTHHLWPSSLHRAPHPPRRWARPPALLHPATASARLKPAQRIRQRGVACGCCVSAQERRVTYYSWLSPRPQRLPRPDAMLKIFDRRREFVPDRRWIHTDAQHTSLPPHVLPAVLDREGVQALEGLHRALREPRSLECFPKRTTRDRGRGPSELGGDRGWLISVTPALGGLCSFCASFTAPRRSLPARFEAARACWMYRDGGRCLDFRLTNRTRKPLGSRDLHPARRAGNAGRRRTRAAVRSWEPLPDYALEIAVNITADVSVSSVTGPRVKMCCERMYPRAPCGHSVSNAKCLAHRPDLHARVNTAASASHTARAVGRSLLAGDGLCREERDDVVGAAPVLFEPVAGPGRRKRKAPVGCSKPTRVRDDAHELKTR
ncbi:hypothetical protein B0H10DRAFT_1938146 [Mycena sp. CBHHK59/15]|nr:hypothetical protein B0H10DRAFT_1938146 [Mycena sp. CBHHK59/15]